MSFVHVLGQIGKGVLKVATVAGSAVPGPVGLLVSSIGAVATAELSGASGADKKQAATLTAETAAPSHPNKAELISQLLEGLVTVFRVIGEFFPDQPAAPPPTS